MKRSMLGFSNAALLSASLLLAASGIAAQTGSGSPANHKNSQVENLQFNKLGISPHMPTNGPQAPENNTTFIKQHVSDTIRDNMAVESAINELALKRSHNPEIKQFAQRVIAQDRKIDLDAKRIAPNQGEALPLGATRQRVDARMAEKKMKTLTDRKFEELYLVQMSDDLRSDIQVGHSAYAMMNLSQISSVGLELWDLSRKRMNELAQIARKAHVRIQTN